LVTINCKNLIIFDLLLGTIQGWILTPVLHAIFVPLLDKIAALELFADDSFITRSKVSMFEFIKDFRGDNKMVKRIRHESKPS
jgi:hypothetical protein